jgi:diguanylate cyclase (GGDEF)-like protein
MATAENHVNVLGQRGAGLTAGESSFLWQLAMRLPHCESLAQAEAFVVQATAASEQSPALREALAVTLAAASDAIRDRERLHALAICDPLTGLSNRRFMEEELDRQLHAMTRLSRPMAVALLDLDHFRRCNEQHGHLAGDLVLRSLAVLLQGFRRRSDVPCRYGGEEFVLIMPATSAADAAAQLEPLRLRLAETGIHHEGRPLQPVTASIGVAEFPTHGTTGTALLSAADAALYRAKRAGRNRICMAIPAGHSSANRCAGAERRLPADAQASARRHDQVITIDRGPENVQSGSQ